MKKLVIPLALAALILSGCSSSAPKIPHQVAQNSDCKSCHATGANGAKVTKHADRANCTGCHKPQQG